MRSPPLLVVAFGAVLAACGDNIADFPRDEQCNPVASTPTSTDILDRLRALGGVTAVEKPTDWPGYRYFDITIDQPVDHENPCDQRFSQHLSLVHRDEDRPMVLLSSGYNDFYKDYPGGMTRLLDGNQISLEHRYFGPSRPVPTDWTHLTIEQAAGDHHRVVAAFRELYPAAWIATGASKGGETTLFHARFYPDDDIQGYVPYVAPLNVGLPDWRYDTFMDSVGPAACRQAVQAVQVEMLRNRRAALEARARDQAAREDLDYSKYPIAAAVESAITGIEFSFWQYRGVSACAEVPTLGATDDAMWEFLVDTSPVSDNSDSRIGQFDAYVYQAYRELGVPGVNDTHIDESLLQHQGEGSGWPKSAPFPEFDATAMPDVLDWIDREGDRILAIYGQWDPWTAARIGVGATDSFTLVEPEGTHGASITNLPAADRATAYEALSRWTGVDLEPSAARSLRADPVLRVPSALLRSGADR